MTKDNFLLKIMLLKEALELKKKAVDAIVGSTAGIMKKSITNIKSLSRDR